MATSFLTSFTEDELKLCIKDTVIEALKEHSPSGNVIPSENIISINEASKLLNLALPTIYALTSKREIPFLKRGKKLYFKRNELEAWLMEGRKLTRQEIEAS